MDICFKTSDWPPRAKASLMAGKVAAVEPMSRLGPYNIFLDKEK